MKAAHPDWVPFHLSTFKLPSIQTRTKRRLCINNENEDEPITMSDDFDEQATGGSLKPDFTHSLSGN